MVSRERSLFSYSILAKLSQSVDTFPEPLVPGAAKPDKMADSSQFIGYPI
jgi:hypothetical protein